LQTPEQIQAYEIRWFMALRAIVFSWWMELLQGIAIPRGAESFQANAVVICGIRPEFVEGDSPTAGEASGLSPPHRRGA
jgi:hypothetical protein